MLPQLLSCAYSYKYLELLWLPKRTQLWACFNTEPNRLYRRLRLFPSKLQEYTPPPFSRLSTQYHIDPLLTCFFFLFSFDTSRTSLRLIQPSTKFSNRQTAHGRYEYSCNLANSRENWAQKKKKIAPRPPVQPLLKIIGAECTVINRELGAKSAQRCRNRAAQFCYRHLQNNEVSYAP